MNGTTISQVVTNIVLAWALALARLDWLVFPLHEPIGVNRCSCSNPACSATGKHPRVTGGFYVATKDAAQIEAWWREWPNANVGIRTGPESGLVVLDVDGDKGFESLEALEAEHGPLPQTVEAITGGGGRHIFFRYPKDGIVIKNRTGMRPGLDVRGDGGYVVGVSSTHACGAVYDWDQGYAPHQAPLADAPRWLIDLMVGPVKSPTPAPALAGSLAEGTRHASLTSLAGTMRRRGMGYAAIEAALVEENAEKCRPALSIAEITKIAEWAAAKPVPDAAGDAAHGVEVPAVLPFRTAAEVTGEHTNVNWLVEGIVTEGTVTEFTGKAKQGGKTTFLLAGVRALLEGAPFLGRPTRRTSVVYLTEERPKTFHQALKRAGLLGRGDLHILHWADATATPWQSVVKAALKKANEVGARLLVIDTVSQWAGFKGEEENSAGAALEALRPVQEASAAGLAVVVVRHERKSGGVVGEAARGSSAFAGAADIVISIRRPEGNTRPTVRNLQTLSRFDTVPPDLVELTPGGYVAVDGDTGDLAIETIGTVLTTSGAAMTVQELIDTTGLKRTTVQDALKTLQERKLVTRLPGGVKGMPFQYAGVSARTSNTGTAAPAALVSEALVQAPQEPAPTVPTPSSADNR